MGEPRFPQPKFISKFFLSLKNLEMNYSLDHHDGDEEQTSYSQHLALSQWDSQKFQLGSLNYLIGSRYSGKFTLLKALYQQICDQIQEVFVFDPCKEHNQRYQ